MTSEKHDAGEIQMGSDMQNSRGKGNGAKNDSSHAVIVHGETRVEFNSRAETTIYTDGKVNIHAANGEEERAERLIHSPLDRNVGALADEFSFARHTRKARESEAGETIDSFTKPNPKLFYMRGGDSRPEPGFFRRVFVFFFR